MGENSRIGWTHHTWNLWRGCVEVWRSPACDHCYARELAKRNPAVLGSWGKGAPRVLAADAYRKLPLKWNAQAEAVGERQRVFSLSMGDWLDDEVPAAWLAELLVTVRGTPDLDWLLLTKRPQNFQGRLYHAMNSLDERAPRDSVGVPMTSDGPLAPASLMIERWYLDGKPPANVWFGITGENNECLAKRWSEAKEIAAAVHFLSLEPLLEDVSDTLAKVIVDARALGKKLWVIAGGESGHHARPMHPQWVRNVRDLCDAAGVPFFFKQWGEWIPWEWDEEQFNDVLYSQHGKELWHDDAPRDPCNLPNRWDAFWFEEGDVTLCQRVGTQAAGHVLDGREWQEFPTAA